MTVAITQGLLATRVRKPIPRIGKRPDYIIRAGIENTFNVFHYQSQTQIQTNISTWYGDTQGVGDAPVAAGSLIEFEAGTHGERNFENFHGTYGNEIKFKASPNGQVVIRRNSGDASGGAVLEFANVKNVILDGGPPIETDETIFYGMKLLSALTGTDGPENFLYIRDNASSNAAGIPSSNITIQNIEIDGGWYTDGTGTFNGTGIGVKQASNYFLRSQHPGTKVENITISGCYVHNLENLGIQTGVAYSSGYIPYTNVVINNCQIANTKKTGLEVHNSWYGDNQIHDNILTDVGNATGGNDINPATGQFFGMSITSGKANVYNNKIYRSGEHTLRIRASNGPLTTDGISSIVSYVYNNVLVEAGIPEGNTNSQSPNDDGVNVARTSTTNIVPPDVYIFNNTIAKCNGAAVTITSPATGNVRNNLLLNNINGNVGGTPTAAENNPTSGSVANIDEDDYTLTAPGTLITGSTFSTVDIDGVTRDVGGEDCGAYEYLGGPISQTDADWTILAGTSDTFSVRKESDQTTACTSTTWIASDVQPGDIVEFEAGVHGMRRIDRLIGTAGNQIIVRSSPLGKATIRAVTNSAGDRVLELRDCHYTTLDGSTTPGETYGIKVMHASSGTTGPDQFIRIQPHNYSNDTIGHISTNVIIQNVEVDGGGWSNFDNGIGIDYAIAAGDNFTRADWGAATVQTANLVIQNCYVHGTEGEGMYLGPNYYKGQIGFANIIVANNIVSNTGWDGINLKSWYTGKNEVYNNTLTLCGNRNDAVSGSKGEHDAIAILSCSANVYNNFIKFSGESGIKVYNYEGPPTTDFAQFDQYVYNNIVYGAGANNINSVNRSDAYGITCNTDADTTVKQRPYIFNNTIVDAGDAGVRLGVSTHYASGGFLKNNLIVRSSPVASWDSLQQAYQTVDNSDSSNLVTVSNNPTSASFSDAANYDFSLTAQTLASGTIGVDITTTDYAGVTREASYPDAGAYEYLGGGSGSSLVVTPNTTAGKNQGVSGPQYDEYSLSGWRNYDDVVDGWDWSYPSSRLT